ncbi:MAG: DUF4350 domain-containing protein [Candidatus Binatia bacterium]
MRTQTYNRWTAGIATGVFVLISGLLASLSTRPSTDSFRQRPSTFFTDPSGARALFLVVKQFLPAAEQWRRPISFLPLPGAQASTLVAAAPARPLSTSEAKHLESWLTAGGQLILFTANGWPLRARRVSNDVDSDEEPAKEDAETGETLLSRYAPSLRWNKADKFNTGRAVGSSVPQGEIILRWRRSFLNTAGAKVVASVHNAAVAVEIPVGQGRIIVIADPTMASNGALRRSDNAVWLVSLVTSWRSGKILFDEYHHGFGQKRGTVELTYAFLMTPWGWCVLQLVAAGLLYVFVYRRRFGRIEEPVLPNRASPLELAEARAGVLRVAAAQGLAANLIVQHLCANLGKAHGKTVDAADLNRELEHLAKSRGAASPATALHALFARVQKGERLGDREFVELGRTAGEIIKGQKYERE